MRSFAVVAQGDLSAKALLADSQAVDLLELRAEIDQLHDQLSATRQESRAAKAAAATAAADHTSETERADRLQVVVNSLPHLT